MFSTLLSVNHVFLILCIVCERGLWLCMRMVPDLVLILFQIAISVPYQVLQQVK